jgi:hypothetical protein
MAGQTMPTQYVGLSAGAPLTGIANAPPVPTGKCESISLAASLATAGADAYLDVFVYGPPGNPLIIYQEPIRWQKPGGSPVLLLNFILQPFTYLVVGVQNSAVKDVNCVAFNRWRFDA